MFPVLLEIGPIKIYSFGFMLVVAFYTCYFLLNFDLKRLGLADAVLGDLKPNWDPSDVLLPIPEAELESNPNLLPQNEGY